MSESTLQKPLRLWPGVVLVVVQWLAWLVVPMFASRGEFKMYGVMVALLAGPLVLLWWVAFSRARWFERLGAVVLVVAAMAAALRLVHPSVAEGNLGFQYFIYAIPVASLAFVTWAALSRHFPAGFRQASMVAVILISCGVWVLLRSEGLGGGGFPEFSWRWSETPEDRLLAHEDDQFAPPPPAPAAAEEVESTGFRGPDRDGVVRGLRIGTDWSVSPPAELWRRPVGPGVSSFAVGDGLLYTQEQRGGDEVVSCYKVASGEPVWRHRDTARFWDSHVGAGPRATPALADGRVYTLGATGIMNALDARSGALVWSRDAASDTGGGVPYFGYVNSPLVVDDVVIVNARKLVAYDMATGDPRWFGPDKGVSYSSPHLLRLGGVPQVLMLRPGRITSVAPGDGSLLWKYRLAGDMTSVLQPALIEDGDFLISTMVDSSAVPDGTRRITVDHGPGGWTVEERWMSNRLKPSFSQIVVHEGHAYGFDGRILACIGLDQGRRKWKGGRYGAGQLLLLPEQDLLLVLSEGGEIALVAASPDRFTELSRIPAIEGKTWSQPSLTGDILLVRNGQEMAAFRLPPELNRVGR
ncbi:MAG TPA: PQQ-binding-like beta-propeller repeat protein [Acidobacteriota bacterium]|nr:PQQ-binding-like beta-propeller repeat protein [Acidobacteriota bacterium]